MGLFPAQHTSPVSPPWATLASSLDLSHSGPQPQVPLQWATPSRGHLGRETGPPQLGPVACPKRVPAPLLLPPLASLKPRCHLWLLFLDLGLRCPRPGPESGTWVGWEAPMLLQEEANKHGMEQQVLEWKLSGLYRTHT
jgi:hypothetical protein